MKSKDPGSGQAAAAGLQPNSTSQPQSPSAAWRQMLIGPEQIEKLIDRLSTTLTEQSQTVRELELARAELDARQHELELARAKAERATETLSTFLKALGHDLRAPFVSIDASMQMLDMDLHAEDIPSSLERLGEIRRTSSHGLALIDDLFELIRSDAGQWRVEPQPVRICEIVADARAVVAPKAHMKRIPLETRWVGEQTDPKQLVETDLVRIRQALVNLLVNAIKFSERGPLIIEVERIGEHTLAFRVLDNGPGIDPDAMQSIFEPFTQSKRTARNAKDGAGLGLAIVRRCARLLGGDVSVVNRNGGGAAFTLEICAPVVVEEVAEDVAEEVVAEWTQEIAADDAVSTPQVPEPSSEASPETSPATSPETRPEPSRAPRSPSSFMPMGASILPPPTPVQGVLPFSVTDDDFGALYRAPREERAIRIEPTAEAVVVQPKPEPVASPTPTPTPSMPAAPRRNVHARKLHALIVDRSADAAAQLSQLLHDCGLEVATASSLAEARGLISQQRPDLIVSERKLPDGSGVEFHDIAPGTRLVLASVNPDPNDLPAGTRVIAKPYTVYAVQEMVRVSLNRAVKFPSFAADPARIRPRS